MESFLLKKNAFQKFGFIILEHKWIISLDQGGGFFMLCKIKENTENTLPSTLPHTALQKD